jgi:hypothetical protein
MDDLLQCVSLKTIYVEYEAWITLEALLYRYKAELRQPIVRHLWVKKQITDWRSIGDRLWMEIIGK